MTAVRFDANYWAQWYAGVGRRPYTEGRATRRLVGGDLSGCVYFVDHLWSHVGSANAFTIPSSAMLDIPKRTMCPQNDSEYSRQSVVVQLPTHGALR